MGVRESIQKHQRWLLPVVLIAAGFGVYYAWQAHASTQLTSIVEKAYYSDDEGKTYFADDVKKGFSFDRGGKTAFRAFVYRCASKGTFVGLLARTVGQAPSVPQVSRSPVDPRNKGGGSAPLPYEVRKPNETKWVLYTSPEAQTLIKSLCPGEVPDTVLP